MATTSISMVREHTAQIRPPRALWVPFDFGRPLGVPGDPEFQRAVLGAALALAQSEHGPVLEDYPIEAPLAAGGNEEGWACPVALPTPDLGASDQIVQLLLDEVARLRPWWIEARRQRGRTAFGLSGLDPDDVETVAALLARFAVGEDVEAPATAVMPLPPLVRYLADDLKAFYTEAVIAQPGQQAATAQEIARWLYTETALGSVLYRLRDRLASSEDPAEQRAQRGLVPGVLMRLSSEQ